MKRRDFIKFAGISAAAGSLFNSPSRLQAQKIKGRPNVLLIIVDDFRPELGCYGVNEIISPNIDRLAEKGLVFNNAYCSQALCNPSRASLLTGKRPDTLRVWDNRRHFRQANKRINTLPQIFRSLGYQTISLGKVFHGTLPDPPSWNRQRIPPDTFNYYQSEETQARQKTREAAALKLGNSQIFIDAYIRGPATEAVDAPDSAYRDGALTEMVLKVLTEHKKKQPFFLAVGFSKPHLPYVAPKKYWDLYNPDQIPLASNNYPPKASPLFAINSHTELACYEDFVQAPNPTERCIPEEQARLLKHGYYACVSFIDAQIGRILDQLKTTGLEENTIIIFTGEHGYKLGEHGAWGKMTNYEIDVRLPLIISEPGRTYPSNSTSALVEIVDIYPTVCELAGLQIPPNLEGISVFPLLRDPDRPWKKAAFSQYPRGFANRFMGRAMRTRRYRFIEWRDRIDGSLVATELYDHQNDPQENINVAQDPSLSELVQKLSSDLAAGWKAALPD